MKIQRNLSIPHKNRALQQITTFLFIVLFLFSFRAIANENASHYFIDNNTSYVIQNNSWETIPQGGDTIFVESSRTQALKFIGLEGNENAPIVIINKGGQVQINDSIKWGAITFENCKYIKITGTGHPGFKYGFLLSAETCGLAFSELSSNCEAGFIKIDHDGFYGIMAKKNYYGNPPTPIPVFSNLSIHDCFIENVSEGMYLGETTSPGMEFKHVKVYNNIVRNTLRESVQIANMVEDVLIYNNTFLDGGKAEIEYQGNMLQIGDNTVAKVYNNLIIGGNDFGIISFGMGNNYFENNYLSSNKGIFVDSRKFTLPDSLIVFSGNYFSNNTNSAEEVIRNMNSENFLVLKDNFYDNENDLFYRNYYKRNTNFSLSNNQVTEIAPVIFTDPESNDYSLSNLNPAEYLNMGAPGGPEFFAYDSLSIPVSEQIVLNSTMLVDEVVNGSYRSPLYLVDEQNSTPENNLHPVSQSWKPYWNMNNAPYHVYIDLQEFYQITKIALHDMHNTKNLDVSIGEPGNWQALFTENCDSYNKWKQHYVDVQTRYIRLSMNESVYAAVNEIVLFGYPLASDSPIKSANLYQTKAGQKIATSVLAPEIDLEKLHIVQNPVVDNLRVHIPEALNKDFTIEVYSINGAKMLEKGFDYFYTEQVQIDLTNDCNKSGIYFLKYTNRQGNSKSIKFIKQ